MLIKKNRTDEEKLYWRAERGDLEKCTGHGAFFFLVKKMCTGGCCAKRSEVLRVGGVSKGI